MRKLFVRPDEAAPLQQGWFPGTPLPESARRAALDVLKNSFREGVDHRRLAEEVPLIRDEVELPEGVQDVEELLSRALLVVLHRNQELYRDLRHALDTGDARLLTSALGELLS